MVDGGGMLHHLHAAAASSSLYLGIIPLQRIRACNNGRPTHQRTSSPTSLYLPPPHVDFISSPSNPFVKLRLSSSYRHSHVVGLTPICEIVRFQASQDERHTSVECLLLLDGSQLPRELFAFPVRAVHVSPTVMRKLAGLQSVDFTVAVALMRIPATFHCMDDDDDDDERALDCEHWFPSPFLLSPNFVSSVANTHLCLTLGSEGKCLSMEAKNGCELITLPMAGSTESLNVSVAGGISL